jgi:hypothetical protein
MRSTFWTILMLAVVAVPGAIAAEMPEHPQPPADARLDFLKQLEGSWTGDFGEEGMGATTYEFRVTAGGHAVEEREMLGTPMEMLTVYHMDGTALIGTHYCMLGNQPRLIAAEKIVDDTLSFRCDGKPGNAASHDEQHVHAWSMRIADDGTLHYDAELVRDGEITEAPTVVLTRQAKNAQR